MRQFLGRIDQVPPAYSAVKVRANGSTNWPGRGSWCQVPPRKVDIYRLEMVDWSAARVTLEVACGPGTYMRALARDLGEALGCGANLAALRRTQSGQFTAEQAVEPARARGGVCRGQRIARHLHPLDAAFAHLPALHLDAEAAYRLTLGQAVPDPRHDRGRGRCSGTASRPAPMARRAVRGPGDQGQGQRSLATAQSLCRAGRHFVHDSSPPRARG